MARYPALVGIVPRRSVWPIIQKEKWYRILVERCAKLVL
jgi:hypothetical protein